MFLNEKKNDLTDEHCYSCFVILIRCIAIFLIWILVYGMFFFFCGCFLILGCCSFIELIYKSNNRAVENKSHKYHNIHHSMAKLNNRRIKQKIKSIKTNKFSREATSNYGISSSIVFIFAKNKSKPSERNMRCVWCVGKQCEK